LNETPFTDEFFAHASAETLAHELELAAIDPPGCPDWCRRTAGHKYEFVEPDGVIRWHSTRRDDDDPRVWIQAEETLNQAGALVRKAPLIWAMRDDEGELTAADALARAATLVAAADQLTAILAVQRRTMGEAP
jgi:hypothetical protein